MVKQTKFISAAGLDFTQYSTVYYYHLSLFTLYELWPDKHCSLSITFAV